MLRLLDALDERHVRLGYVNCVVLMAGRQLDTRQALRRRFDSLVFKPIYEGELEWRDFDSFIDDKGRKALELQKKQRDRPVKDGGSRKTKDPLAGLRRRESKGFRYSSHFWLLQGSMRSHLGPLDPGRSEVFVDHAVRLGFISETYTLTEAGAALQQLLMQDRPHLREVHAKPNPMEIAYRTGVEGLYLRALLEHDAITPFLLREVCRRGKAEAENRLLADAASGLLEAYKREASVEHVQELRRLRDYVARITRTKSGRSGEGGPKVYRHHLRPRLEHYIDVGLLERQGEGSPYYVPTLAGRRAVEEWKEIIDQPRGIRRFLDERFASSAALIYGKAADRCTDREGLLYFVRGFRLVGRPIGFTPARTVALVASLLALEEGKALDIEQLFAIVSAAAGTPMGEHLIFSGGSRFDREFLIRVRPELEAQLRQLDT